MPSFLRPPILCSSLSLFPSLSFILFPRELPSLSLMATSPRDPLDYPPESRAPPPSPVAGPRADGSEAPGDDELAGFLSRSLRIPELNLPDRIFPRNPTLWNPPEIDFQAMVSQENDGSAVELLKSTGSAFGCFQHVNHGIPRDSIAACEVAAAAAFSIPPEKKKKAAWSPERRWGFEVEEEEEEGGEELFWYRREIGEVLAGIWPPNSKDISDKIVRLWMEIERIASKIEEILLENGARCTQSCFQKRSEEGAEGTILCLHKHGQNNSVGGLKNEVLRTVIRSSGCSHALSLHLCCRATEFHVYSKRGWFQFCPSNEAIVVTIGNQIQACSGGLYRHVIGKPVFQDGDHNDSVTIAFFYCQPGFVGTLSHPTVRGEKAFSLTQQVMIGACLVLLCRIITYLLAASDNRLQ